MKTNIEHQNLSKIAIKNSGYSLASTLIYKIGGLIFTILIARLLLPELFGIYALTLSIIAIFLTFTDLGINETFLRYFSEALTDKNKNKAGAYFRYLLKIKSLLVFIIIIILLFLSKFLSYNIYNKPLLFYPLIFASLFLLAESFKNFFGNILVASKHMKPLPFLELLHQIIKISFSVLVIFLLSIEFKVAGLFFVAALAGFIHLFFLFLISYKKDKSIFIKEKVSIDKKRISKFLSFMSIASLSLIFFVSVDILMLGKFVESEYIAYYRVALSLVLTIASLFSMSGVLLPIFTQIHKKRFERGFQKTFRYLMLIAIPATIGIIFTGKHIIFAIYGNEYLLATSSLYFLSALIIITPLTILYTIIFESREKTKILAKSVLISLTINIILNYILIKYLLNFSQEYAIIGVGIATITSRFIYLSILISSAKHKFKLEVKGIGLRKPIFATLIMGVFLWAFNYFIDMNLFFGVVEIILGIGIYFGVLILIKGVGKEDWNLIKSLVKR